MGPTHGLGGSTHDTQGKHGGTGDGDLVLFLSFSLEFYLFVSYFIRFRTYRGLLDLFKEGYGKNFWNCLQGGVIVLFIIFFVLKR